MCCMCFARPASALARAERRARNGAAAMRYLCHAYLRIAFVAVCLDCFTACEAVLGLDDFSVVQQTDDSQVSGHSCTAHADCAGSGAELRCVPALKVCAAVHTPECAAV